MVFENLMMRIKEVLNTNGVNEWWLGSGGLDFITLRYLIVVPDFLKGFLGFVKKYRCFKISIINQIRN